MKGLALYLIVPAIAGMLIGSMLALWRAPPAQPPQGPTPQQRIDEAFDAFGMQRRPLPPGWPRKVD